MDLDAKGAVREVTYLIRRRQSRLVSMVGEKERRRAGEERKRKRKDTKKSGVVFFFFLTWSLRTSEEWYLEERTLDRTKEGEGGKSAFSRRSGWVCLSWGLSVCEGEREKEREREDKKEGLSVEGRMEELCLE